MVGWIVYPVDGKMCNRVEGTRVMARVAPEGTRRLSQNPEQRKGTFRPGR